MKWYLSIILLVIPFLLLADPVYLGNGQNEVSVLVSNAQETVLQYNIGHFDAHKIEIGTRQWHHLALPGEGVTQVKVSLSYLSITAVSSYPPLWP